VISQLSGRLLGLIVLIIGCICALPYLGVIAAALAGTAETL